MCKFICTMTNYDIFKWHQCCCSFFTEVFPLFFSAFVLAIFERLYLWHKTSFSNAYRVQFSTHIFVLFALPPIMALHEFTFCYSCYKRIIGGVKEEETDELNLFIIHFEPKVYSFSVVMIIFLIFGITIIVVRSGS